MTIEVALLISIFALAFSIFFGLSTNKRNKTKDDKQDASQLTMVIVKLENIGNGVSEIKQEISSVKEDGRKDRECIIRLEESVKQAHKRMDAYDRRKEEDIQH
jgi:peptidoglycan hydrolase CwlO-like protein